MPVTLRYSAALERTYEYGGEAPEPPPASPSTESRSSGTSSSSSYGGGGTMERAPSSAASEDSCCYNGRRAGSTDSLDTGGGGSGHHSRQTSFEGGGGGGTGAAEEFIPTRTVKRDAKPAFNPLQFVKTGKSKLVRTAEQQIKMSEEVKKVKERVREDEEAWQSNLDNWKSKRRQISHKTIAKAEEIKQIEEVEFDRQRKKKSKTFNEMMEDRSKRGTASALPTYNEWGHEVTAESEEGGASDDMGVAKGDVSFESSDDSERVYHEDEGEDATEDKLAASKPSNGNGVRALSASPSERVDSSFVTTRKPTNGHRGSGAAGEEPEFTFEKAIQSYAQYAESTRRTNAWVDNAEESSTSRRSPAATTTTTNNNSNNNNNNNSEATAAEEDNHAEKMERASGQRLSVVVCLRRGGDSKEFGFGIKSIRGIGTGIFVENVHPQSPAESAGLKVNDEILAINGELCTAKRTHSAIVFAVKQAVYTGNLELEVYRYDDTDAIQKSRSSESNSPAKSAASPTPRALDRSSSETVLHHPPPTKVDLLKRRSVFEMTARPEAPYPEKKKPPPPYRRSLDVSARIKDKLASFESGEPSDRQSSADFRRSPGRVAAFREKMASFRSLESLEQRRGPTAEEQRRGPDEESAEDSGEYGRRGFQAFERTRSCECLDFEEDFEESEGVVKSGPDRKSESYEALSAQESERQFEADLSELRMSVCGTGGGETMPGFREDVANLEETPGEGSLRGLDEPMPTGDQSWMMDSEESALNGSAFDEKLRIPLSGFELADSLEETPITGSEPGSPRQADSSQEFGLGSQHDSSTDADVTLSSLDAAALGSQLEDLDLSAASVFVVDLSADAPLKTLEPPKEKPPPPPVEATMDYGQKIQPDKLKRVDSTKRIRTEIWKRRTDFLGIDGEDVQKLMQDEIESVTPPPTLENLLREEVFGGHGHGWKRDAEDVATSEKREASLGLDGYRTRDNNQEDIARKEREIIENLEWEEEQRLTMMQKREDIDEDEDSGRGYHEKEANQQHQVEPEEAAVEKMLYERKSARENFAQPMTKEDEAPPPHQFYPESDLTLKMREEELQRQEELLRLEKEKLRLEQEELLRQKEAYQKRIEDHQRSNIGVTGAAMASPVPPPSGTSATSQINISINNGNGPSPREDARTPSSPIYETIPMPALLSPEIHATRGVPQPPPTPTKAKAVSPAFNDRRRVLSPGEMQEPSNGALDKWPAHPRVAAAATMDTEDPLAPLQPLTKQALFALSASPKVKLMEGDQWMAARRKTNNSNNGQPQRRDDYNRHWLVQEAEFRRLHPQQQQQQQQQQPQQQQQVLHGDAKWQQSPPPPSTTNWKSPPTSSNGHHSPSNGVYGAATGNNAKSVNQAPRPANASPARKPPNQEEAPYAVPHLLHQRQASSHQQQQHQRQQQQHFAASPPERRLAALAMEAPPVKAAAAPPPPPHPPKPSGHHHQKSNSNSSVAPAAPDSNASQMLSVSGKKKCSHCTEELGRGAAMIIESLQLFYHINCFKCCVCHIQLGNGSSGADVRVRSQKLHCHNCYSNDEGLKFSKV